MTKSIQARLTHVHLQACSARDKLINSTKSQISRSNRKTQCRHVDEESTSSSTRSWRASYAVGGAADPLVQFMFTQSFTQLGTQYCLTLSAVVVQLYVTCSAAFVQDSQQLVAQELPHLQREHDPMVHTELSELELPSQFLMHSVKQPP